MNDVEKPRRRLAAKATPPVVDSRVALALTVARALGAPFEATPPTRASAQTMLANALDAVRASGGSVSLGAVVSAMRAPGVSERAVRRGLSEAEAILSQQSYSRTKRAERGRLLAELLAALELESIVGVEPTADLEETVRRTRRAADLVLRGGRGKGRATSPRDERRLDGSKEGEPRSDGR